MHVLHWRVAHNDHALNGTVERPRFEGTAQAYFLSFPVQIYTYLSWQSALVYIPSVVGRGG